MPRIKKMVEREDGWSDWVTPVMDGYRMACCDCGLVHTLEFHAVRKGKDLPNGTWLSYGLSQDKFRVMFRARRNNRATAQVRRWKKS